MDTILWLECESGISGDMSVAALLDLGADVGVLRRALDSLRLEGMEIIVSRVTKSGLDCADFNVVTDSPQNGLDHDMEYLYGHGYGGRGAKHGHEHEYGYPDEEHEHGYPDEEQDHGHGHGHHEHRSFREIREMIAHAEMTSRAKTLALRIFEILAKAEAKAHGVSADEVHFHEVGAVDSIADIVGFAVCYDNLGIERTVILGLAEGGGTVRCQHGILPVPVPAVVNIAADNGLPLKRTGVQGELVTPTGAAIAAAVRTDAELPERYVIRKTGLGAGKRSYELPGFVRAMLIEDTDGVQKDGIYRLESDIDDCSGEVLGFTQGLLYEAGAREVHYTPIFMKKNRPAYELVVICDEAHRKDLENIIFRNTTTIGIRRVRMERTVLERGCVRVNTSLGEADVKVCTLSGERFFYPEYESVAAISRQQGLSYMDVYERIRKECADGP